MKDLTQGPVTKHLLHMAAFLAVSMLAQTLYLLADLYWVGRLGKEAIAAVGVAGNFMMIVLALTQMLGVGTTTLISQAAGRKDQAQARTHLQPILRVFADELQELYGHKFAFDFKRKAYVLKTVLPKGAVSHRGKAGSK